MSFFADFFGNGGTPPPYQPPQLPQRFLQPSPVPEMQIRDVRQGLLSDKQGWDTSNRAMNLLTKQLETPDLTDEQKQKLNNDIADWKQQRDAFAASANDRRAQANALGIDVSDYGSDKTLRDASQAYNTYRNAAIRDFLNLPTVAQLEENRYRELRSNGASPGQAHRIINREHNLRQEDFLRKAAEGIMTYGTNPDGTLNEIGLQLTQRMNPDNPQIAASLFANGFAMPKDIFKEDRADNRTLLGINATAAQQQAQRDFQKWATIYGNDAQDNRLKWTLEQRDRELASREKIAQLNATYKKLGGSGNKMMEDVETLVSLGMPREQAMEFALRQNFSKAFESVGKDDKTLQDKEKFKTFVGGQFATIEYYLRQKNYTIAKELIGKFRESIHNPENKYSELAGAANTQYMLDRLQRYEDVADGKDSLQALKELEEGVVGDGSPADFKKLEEYHRNTGTVDDARKTADEAARKARQPKNIWDYPPPNYDPNTGRIYGAEFGSMPAR